MRLLFWVTALAVLSIAWAKNSTAKAKPKRQLDNIRSPQNLQYSLVLPHSRVSHFRSLNNNRRISHGAKGGKLPPYAVQMEPVVQYSQKDPLYDPTHENLDDSAVNQNQIYAQSKILNTQDSLESFGPPYGSLPTAPLYSHEPQPQYYEAPEPIIEIIIKESNETLPAPPPPPVQKKKKEPVHVFYVKYSKDPHSHDKVIYDKPIPAITPSTNEEEDEHHHEEYVTVTPEPYIHRETTTLRALIKPESEQYHSDSSVKITFGSEGRHYSDRRKGSHDEDREETAPRPAIAFPNQNLQQSHPPLERTASPKPQYSHETELKSTVYHPSAQTYKQNSQHAQSRIQFQPQAYPTEQQLPRQNPTAVPFRSQSHIRHPFGSSPSLIGNPAFSNGPPGLISHFSGPTIPTPVGPSFQTAFPRTNSGPSFNSRPSNSPSFGSRPPFNGPPRATFHSGPQRPFHQPQPQSKPFFDEAKYLQENYHTITTEQVDPPKEQILPNRQPPTFSRLPQVGPSPTPAQFQDHFSRPQIIPHSQQLPQQRPPQHFIESKPSLSPSSSPFFNLKPSPPHVESNRPAFQSSQQFGFHQGPQTFPGPSASPSSLGQHSFSSPISASPSSIPQTQFLPQPSSPPLYNFQPQPSPTPEVHFHRPSSPSDRPQFLQPQGPSERPPFYQTHGPSERPTFSQQTHFRDQHQQNVGQLVPNGGELIPAIPKYEQHITVNGPGQTQYNLLGESKQPSPSPSNEQHYQYQQQQRHEQHQRQEQQQRQEQKQQQQREQQREQQQLEHQQQQLREHQQQQHHEQQQQQQQLEQQQQQHREQQQQQQREQQHREQQQQQQQQYIHQQHQQQQNQQQQQQQHQQQQQQQNQHHQQQQHQQQQQQQHQQQQQQYDAEQEQVRQQLAQNVQKQQEEIQRLQTQLYLSQQQEPHLRHYNQQIEATSPRSQYIQERSRYQSSTSSPQYYQSTSGTVEIKPSTQKYVPSSTANSISTTPNPQKDEKKKKLAFELPDEVPDDLRQQLLSSGILDNADISVLDYDKVGDTPLNSLPPDQLANFFSAGGAQQIAGSENSPIYVKPNGDQIESRNIDDMEDDQEIAASENIPSYVAAPPSEKQAVEMKVVHFNPNTAEGQKIAKDYVQENATQLEPVALNDKKYNRYLPLKVSGNQFPLPDVLKGRKVTSVVVLAPVETEALNADHARKERSTNSLKGIKFVAGDSLQDLLKKPTKDNFEKWLTVEKKTAADLQSIILLVTGNEAPQEDREIYMYDIASGNVNKLSGELSNAFVEAAENNSLSKNIESLAIEGEGVPENFQKDDVTAEGSENVPLFVDLSGVSLDDGDSNSVSISSSYSKTKLGRSLRRHH